MVVSTRTPEVVEARASVFEFLLINHPLDCPVCDKGGECPLQDFSYSFGPNESRMEFPRRVFDGEGVRADVDFGPTLMLNRNRCILCTRCVRFMREVDTDAQINIVDRGYGSEIATFQEEGVHSLLSGNLMDVCPVGAITTRDYRFKSRPWDNPEAVDTICTLCEKGCNTTAWIKAKPEWAKGAQLIRTTPRYNPDVNGYWMCDIGRFDYRWIEGDERLQRPLVRTSSGRSSRRTGRARSRNSRNGSRRRRTVGAPVPRFRPRVARGAVSHRPARRDVRSARAGRRDQLAAPREAAAAGCEVQDSAGRCAERQRRARPGVPGNGLWARARPTCRPSAQRSSTGALQALYVFDPGPEGYIGDVSWIIDAKRAGRLPLLIVHGVLMTALAKAADIVLPGASWVEKDASYVNGQGRLQAASRVDRASGRGAGRLAGIRERRAGARRCADVHEQRGRSEAISRPRCRATRATQG